MIAYLEGKLTEKTPTHVVVDCGGVGYFVKISLNTFSKIEDTDKIKIFTQLQVREDAHTLFGFHTTNEREMFNHLISVSGIGATTAMIMLSSMTPEEIAFAISHGDVASIQRIKGIGAKTAQRVIIDLKDKVIKSDLVSENMFVANNTNQNDALTALLSLGFDRKKAEKAVSRVLKPDQTVEEIIKEALKVL